MYRRMYGKTASRFSIARPASAKKEEETVSSPVAETPRDVLDTTGEVVEATEATVHVTETTTETTETTTEETEVTNEATETSTDTTEATPDATETTTEAAETTTEAAETTAEATEDATDATETTTEAAEATTEAADATADDSTDDEADSTPTQPMGYGPPRVRPRPAERDLVLYIDKLDEEARREFEEERRRQAEREEKERLDAERIEELKKEVLMVESINEHIDTNTEDHHTDLFECTEDDERPQLVVRRGQEFKLTFTFQRPYDKENDDLYLIFKTGETPKIHKKTCAHIKLREDDKTRYMTGKKKKWGACCVDQSENSLTVSVYTPPNAVIGEWEYTVRTVTAAGEKLDYDGDQDIILLLNPWCEDDQVYMENTDDLKEYILNPTGSVFSGSSRKIRSKPWNYGQFQNGVLDICIKLLRTANGKQVSVQMSDPVFIARALSRILNSFGEFGVLTGRWDGEYDDGVRPLTWKGSAAILKQYNETNEDVKYGQCWVFSHLLTTVARALGLPCRSVTNFSSAHDTNLTMTIDKYFDEDGDEVDHLNSDSVWNFHVWNDVWMRRPDLDRAFDVNGKYDGWQAVDATPQEISEGSFQCGPSPLNAIKLGEVHVGYDTKFIFGEVNAECCDWKNTEPPTLINRNTHRVGKFISTKYPDGEGYKKYPGWDLKGTRLDVTDLYKAAEGSAAERAAVAAATEQGAKGDLLFGDNSGVELSLEEPSAEIGDDFVIKIKATNSAEEARTFKISVTVRPATYWGGLIGTSKIASIRPEEDEVLQPGEEKTYEIPVDANMYVMYCDDAMTMRVLAIARVADFANSPALLNEDFSLAPPDIAIQAPEAPVVAGELCNVEVTFKNPLHQMPLTECVLKVDGDMYLDNEDFDLKYAVYSKLIGVIDPDQEQSFTLLARPSVKPKKSKRREVTVTLASKELPDMEGSATIFLE